MKKVLAMAAVAATIATVSAPAHASFSDTLRQAMSGSISAAGAAIRGYSDGFSAGSVVGEARGAAAKHAENTAKVHRFAGDAYTRATGIALYGGVGRASRNLAAALDAQGAEITRLNGVITDQQDLAAQAVVDARRAGYGDWYNAERTLVGQFRILDEGGHALDSSLARTNLGTHRYNDTAPVSAGTMPYDSPNSYGLRGITSAASDEFFVSPNGDLVANVTINGVVYGAGSNLHQLDIDAIEDAGYTVSTTQVRSVIRTVVSTAIKSAWSDGYDEGYRDGYRDGYKEGYFDGVASVQ